MLPLHISSSVVCKEDRETSYVPTKTKPEGNPDEVPLRNKQASRKCHFLFPESRSDALFPDAFFLLILLTLLQKVQGSIWFEIRP